MTIAAIAALAGALGHAALKRPVSATCFALVTTFFLIEIFLH